MVLGAVGLAALVAVIVVALGSGGSQEATETTHRRRTQTTSTTRPRTSTTTSTTSTSTPTTTSTTPPTTTPSLPPRPANAIDLGSGVDVLLPDGWERTDGLADAIVQMSDGTLHVDVRAVERTPGEDPAVLLQQYLDLYDEEFAAAGYSPATLRGADGDDGEVRRIGLYYRAIDEDLTGINGGAYLFQRDDGLTVLFDIYGPEDEDLETFPEEDALVQSLLDAPPVGESVEFGDFAPVRVTSTHPTLLVDELIGFALPPGWVDASAGGAAITNNNLDETVVAVKLTGQPDADAAAAAAQADFASRYPGFTYGAAETADARADLERRDIRLDAVSDPNIDGRPRVGSMSVWFDPASGNAISFARFWYSDVTSDGSEPNDAATDFIWNTLADSFDTIA